MGWYPFSLKVASVGFLGEESLVVCCHAEACFALHYQLCTLNDIHYVRTQAAQRRADSAGGTSASEFLAPCGEADVAATSGGGKRARAAAAAVEAAEAADVQQPRKKKKRAEAARADAAAAAGAAGGVEQPRKEKRRSDGDASNAATETVKGEARDDRAARAAKKAKGGKKLSAW